MMFPDGYHVPGDAQGSPRMRDPLDPKDEIVDGWNRGVDAHGWARNSRGLSQRRAQMTERLWKTCGLGVLGSPDEVGAGVVGGRPGSTTGKNGSGSGGGGGWSRRTVRPGQTLAPLQGGLFWDEEKEILSTKRTYGRPIADATRSRNDFVAKNDMKLVRAAQNQEAVRQAAEFTSDVRQSVGSMPHAGTRSFRSSRLMMQQGKDGIMIGYDTVDSAALAAEIEQVTADLKRLMSGENDQDLKAGRFDATMSVLPRGKQAGKDARNPGAEEVAEEEDEEPDRGLLERILQYRYVRRIEAPPPPLARLEDFPPDPILPKDKMELNLTPGRIRWNVPEVRKEELAKSRELAKTRASEAARKKGDLLKEFEAKIRKEISQKLARDGFCCKAWDQLVDGLKQRRARREDRTRTARVYRDKALVEREERIRDNLAEKHARASASRSMESTRSWGSKG